MKSMSLRGSRKGQSGFTLVEIAIVLVIIGLLLGGVLKGQEMITNAKVSKVENDYKGITAAILAYQDRYGVLPGDDGVGGGAPRTVAQVAGSAHLRLLLSLGRIRLGVRLGIGGEGGRGNRGHEDQGEQRLHVE